MKALSFFDEMYCKYSNKLFTYVTAKVKNSDEAEDLVSEIWIKVFNHLNLYQPDKAKFNTWLFTIANNHCIDYFRKAQSEKRKFNPIVIVEANDDKFDAVNSLMSESDTQKEIENRELKAKLTKAMKSLKPNYRCVAELYLVQDRSYDEIAEILDIPLGTVKATLFRAKELLQSALSKKTMQLA
jgi:RNA polymerase sigma factor (sigma-70 family)